MSGFFQSEKQVNSIGALVLAGIAIAAGLTAQTPAAPKDKGDLFTATTDNITGAKDSIRIELRRWSTDDERNQVLSAWTKAAAPAAAGRGPEPDPAAGRGGGRGRGGEPPPRLGPEAALAAAVGNTPSLGTLWSSETTGY